MFVALPYCWSLLHHQMFLYPTLRLLHSRREPAETVCRHNRGGQRERLRKSGQSRRRMGTMGSRDGRQTWAAKTAHEHSRGVRHPRQQTWTADMDSRCGQQMWTADDSGDGTWALGQPSSNRLGGGQQPWTAAVTQIRAAETALVGQQRRHLEEVAQAADVDSRRRQQMWTHVGTGSTQ